MPRKKSSFSRFLYKSHRHIGISMGLIFLLLAITGIALNHTTALQLEKRFIHSPLLLQWYGITPAKETSSAFKLPEHWLMQKNQQLYLDKKPILQATHALIGAVAINELLIVAFSNTLVLLNHAGELIEQIDKKGIEKVGRLNNALVLKIDEQFYYSDDRLLSWQQLKSADTVLWSKAQPLPSAHQQFLKQIAPQHALNYERLILDLHSGRFFGKYGVYLIDLSGILLILLTLSGSWLWLKHQFKRRN